MTDDHSTDKHKHDPHDHGHDDHAHDGHDDHGHGHGHEDDASAASTLVPTTWRQLIFPALIVLLVGILLIGPITGAFAPRPAPATTEEVHTEDGETGGPVGEPTQVEQVEVEATVTTAPARPSATTAPAQSTSTPVAIAPTATSAGLSADAIATRTAVAVAGAQGDVTRAPQQLQFAGAQFSVIAGGEVLPDWKTTAEEGKAVWITGTYANHVIYLPFSASNAALFSAAKQGDTVSLIMDTGQTFEFEVTRSERAYNGPPTTEGQFTTTTAMNQDHAGVTLFLVGEAASDRAVVQADFTGNIQ